MTTNSPGLSSDLPVLRKNGFFKAILVNSDTLEGICGEYLFEARSPNIAGLCARLGTTPQELRRLFAKPETDLDSPSRESLSILANTIMQIEDRIVTGGLTGSFNAHMECGFPCPTDLLWEDLCDCLISFYGNHMLWLRHLMVQDC